MDLIHGVADVVSSGGDPSALMVRAFTLANSSAESPTLWATIFQFFARTDPSQLRESEMLKITDLWCRTYEEIVGQAVQRAPGVGIAQKFALKQVEGKVAKIRENRPKIVAKLNSKAWKKLHTIQGTAKEAGTGGLSGIVSKIPGMGSKAEDPSAVGIRRSCFSQFYHKTMKEITYIDKVEQFVPIAATASAAQGQAQAPGQSNFLANAAGNFMGSGSPGAVGGSGGPLNFFRPAAT